MVIYLNPECAGQTRNFPWIRRNTNTYHRHDQHTRTRAPLRTLEELATPEELNNIRVTVRCESRELGRAEGACMRRSTVLTVDH